MLCFPRTSNPIARHQQLKNQRPCPRAIIRKLILLLISHSNTPCKSTFGSFMIKRIGTSDARHVYSVFLARLSPAISVRCPKIKHHWAKSEASRPNNEVRIHFAQSSYFGNRENHWLHKRFWFNDKRSANRRFCPCAGNLARLRISVESQVEYTEEKKEGARRRIRK